MTIEKGEGEAPLGASLNHKSVAILLLDYLVMGSYGDFWGFMIIP